MARRNRLLSRRLEAVVAEGESTKKHFAKRPSDIDREIGINLRKWRLARNMEAGELADRLGVTYQQLHKYEKGLTRMTVSRLHDIARTLDVPITWFFHDRPDVFGLAPHSTQNDDARP